MYIRNGTGEAFERFEKLPIPIKFKLRFFNVTNPNEFNGNLTSIIYNQVGPYVFDEVRFKEDIEFDHTGNEVSFREKKNYTFNAKESAPGLNASDLVTVFNLGLVCIFPNIIIMHSSDEGGQWRKLSSLYKKI